MNMRQRGFSLLELLVAFAIMAFSLVALYQATGGSIDAARRLDGYSRALILAESLLDQRDSVPAGGWNESGVWEGYAWQISSSPHQTSPAAGAAGVLHRVRLQLHWGDAGREQTLSVDTLLPEEVSPIGKRGAG